MAKRHDLALKTALAGASGLTSLLSSATAIYAGQAIRGAVLPYVVYFHQAGGRANEFAGNHDDVYYTVKGVADRDANGMLVAAQIQDAIETALHRPSSDLTYENSWVHRAVTVVGNVFYVETVDEKAYVHAGHIVRLRADK